jgi:hypothetical protein
MQQIAVEGVGEEATCHAVGGLQHLAHTLRCPDIAVGGSDDEELLSRSVQSLG